jgi:hypothetical protein
MYIAVNNNGLKSKLVLVVVKLSKKIKNKKM